MTQPKPYAVSASRNRRLDIQGLRAIAILMVVAFHAGLPVAGGFVGVDVFFVISGFVITAMLHREWTATGRIRFGQFYIRRFKRLTPALALMVAVTVLLSALLLSPLGTQQTAAKTAIGAILLVANFVIARGTGGYFDAPAATNPLLNTWSLSVEEQFYLAFPAIVALGWLIARRRRGLKTIPYLLVGAIAAVTFSLAVLTSTGWTLPRAPWLLGFYSPFTRAWEFAVGALLALAVTKLTITSRNLGLALGLLGAALLTASLWLVSGTTPFPGVWTLLPVAGTLLLLAVGNHDANTVTRVLATRPMVKVGDWSYSIYLWHWPLIVVTALLWPNNPAAVFAAAVLSFAPAIASYKWVEQPIRGLRTASKRRLATIVLAVVIPPFVLAATLGAAPRLGLLPEGVSAALDTVSEKHASSARGCLTRGPFTAGLVANCEWNPTATGAPIYLVGDSSAWHFTEAAIGAGELLGRPVWVFTTESCPLIPNLDLVWLEQSQFFPSAVDHKEFDHCDSYVNYTLDWLRRAPPGIVFVAALDQYWWDRSIGAALEGGAVLTTDRVGKAAILREGLASTVRDLEESGHQVVLVQSIPTYRNPTPIWDPRTCTTLAVLNGKCSRDVPTAFIDDLQRTSRAAIEDVAETTGSSVLDLRGWFCNTESCSTDRDGAYQYQDATHLTVSASRALAPQFAKAVPPQRR